MLNNKQEPWFGVDQTSPRHKLSTRGKSWHERVLEMPTELWSLWTERLIQKEMKSLGWLKQKTVHIQIVDKDRADHFIAVLLLYTANENGNNLLGKTFFISFKANYSSTLWPSNSSSRYLSKRNENMCSQKDSHRNVYSSPICNNHKLEMAQMSINRRMDKQVVAYSYHKKNSSR